MLNDEPAGVDNPCRNVNDKFLCTGNEDTSCFSKTIAAHARPSYAPGQSKQYDDN